MNGTCDNYSAAHSESVEAEVYSDDPKKTMVVLRCVACGRRNGLRMVRKNFVSIADHARSKK